MASYQAKIDVIVGGIRELAALEGRLEQIQNIASALKRDPIDLNIGGRGKSRDLSGRLSKEINDVVRSFTNGERKLGSSLSSINQQASLFRDVLGQTALKGNGVTATFQKQDPIVRQLVTVYNSATAASKNFELQQRNVIRTSQGLQTEIQREIQLIQRRTKVARLREQKRARQEALSSGIVGGAFPLLFGGGPGASLFGGLGGAAGGALGGQFGLGLSLVGTQLGTVVDNFTKNLSDIASSLGDPTKALEALETAGLAVDDSVKVQVETLLELGKVYEAQDLVLKEINRTLGPQAVGQLSAYKDESDKLNSTFQAITAEVTKELVPALLGFITVINQIVDVAKKLPIKESLLVNLLTNPITSIPTVAFAAAQQIGKRKGEQAGPVQLTAEQLEQVRKIERLSADTADNLRRQVELSDKKLAAAKINKKVDLDAWLVAQQQVVLQEYRNKNEEIYVEYKRKGLKEDVRKLMIQQNMQDRDLKLANLLRDYGNTQDQINKKALADAQQIAKAKASAEISEIRSLKALFASSVARTRQIDGELAAVNQRLKQLQEERDGELEILNIRYKEQDLNAKSEEEREALYRTYLNQYQVVVNTYSIEKLKTEELKSQLEIYGVMARLSAAAGFNVSGELAGAFVPKGAAGILSPGAGLTDFMTGAQLAPIIEQEVALARVLEKYQEIGQAAQLTSELVTTGFIEMVSGAKTVEQTFADFLNSLADMLIKTAQQMIAQYIAIGIARMFAMGESASSVAKGIGFSPIASYTGSGPISFAGFPIDGKANGGPVSGGTPYIVGERGPELFVPRASGTIVPNDKMGGGVTVGSINISVENSGDSLSPAAQKQIAGQVQGIVLSTLANERRSGGML